ncbi:hypothetical protein TELCIR_19911, partial [Teladorsagia circumcincta]
IDYNVEQASIRVSRAVDSVKKAEKHQRNDKKMHCIFCQTVAIIVILLLIIFTKLRTTHEFVYGAIAELVDNSRDAMANNLHIDY